MAEIKIERKKNNSLWIWLIVLVLLALIGWAVYEFVLKENEVETMETVPGTGMLLTDERYHQVA